MRKGSIIKCNKQHMPCLTSLWWFDYGRRLFKTLGIRSCNCPCCYFKSSAKGPTDRQAIKIAPPPPRFLFPFLRQSGRVGGVSQTLPFFACSTFYFPYLSFFLLLLCVFAAPFCASDRGRQRRSVQRSDVCLAGIFFKKNHTAASPFPFHFFLQSIMHCSGKSRVPLFILTRSEDLSSSYFFPSAALIV